MKARTTPLFSMIVLVLCLALAMLTTSCATLGIQTDAQRIATACATASASVKVLTEANRQGKLDELQQAAILSAIDLASPICAADVAPTLDDVKREAFLAAIAALEAAVTQTQGATP